MSKGFVLRLMHPLTFSLGDVGDCPPKGLMGTLKYGRFSEINFDDRLLAHLQIVIGAKLRRGESFYFSWVNAHDADRGRTTIWLHPSMSLKYKYYVSQMPRINAAWIEELALSANSSAGLYVGDEPTPSTNH
jgi:hypothetical protein